MSEGPLVPAAGPTAPTAPLAVPTGPTAPTGRLARLWARPLVAHVAMLALVLGLGLFLIGPRVGYSSDEGAALSQARLLVRDHTWLYRYPLAGIDPQDQARPFIRGDRGTKGVAPYAKHPLYPAVLAGADWVAGPAGWWVLTLIGTVGAAAMAALLARRLDPRLTRATLWVVGVGSPLLFDAYFVLAHSLAAFAAGAGALALLVGIDPDRPWLRRIAWWAAAGVFLAWSAMLRTEALFLGPALAAAVVGLALFRRIDRVVAVGAAAAAFGGAVGAWLIDRVTSRLIIGAPLPGVTDAAPASWMAGRWQALDTTWFRASYSGQRVGDLAVFLAALLLVAAAVAVRLRPSRRDVAAVLAAGAAIALVIRLALGSPGVIAGLALAFPLGWVGLWSLRRATWAGVASPLLTAASGLVVVAVLLTEYPRGGGIEWGGRYFAVVLPLAAPVLVAAAAAAVRHRPPDRLARWAPGLAVALCVLPALLAIQALRSAHDATARTLDAMSAAAATAGQAPGRDRTVVVSRNRLLPQIAYTDFGRYDWVVPDDLAPYGDRLVAAGIDRVVLVSPDPAADLATLPGWRMVGQVPPGLPIGVAVIEHDPAAN